MNINKERLGEFQEMLAKNGLDAYIVSSKADQGFLTGYFTADWLLVVGRKKAWAVLSVMLKDQFLDVVPFCGAVASADVASSAVELASKQHFKKVGFDPAAESYLQGAYWKKKGFLEKPGLLAELRLTKRGEEIKNMRQAGQIAAEAFRKVKPRIRPGMTECGVRLMLERAMQDMGATGPSFDTIIGAGSNSALPHHCTSERVIKNNQVLLLDFGCVYNHYCSDMTRTIFLGKPDKKFLQMYRLVERAYHAGLATVRDGMSAFDVDKACRDVISKAGCGEYFIHGTGHGVGIDIHEPPRLNTRTTATLKAGMVVTVEPGVYFHGKFGIRIEDTVLVTDRGGELLTGGLK
ncbi:MAG TPA: aminopeptidase P family protein [Elusimicrobiales bacterium]|nr:aminopeptidase P family protein [Elusimicrobiales bacterium]